MADKFKVDQLVRWHGMGQTYRVIGTPSEGYTMHVTGEIVYLYYEVLFNLTEGVWEQSDDPHVWVLTASEMEDGRFEVVK